MCDINGAFSSVGFSADIEAKDVLVALFNRALWEGVFFSVIAFGNVMEGYRDKRFGCLGFNPGIWALFDHSYYLSSSEYDSGHSYLLFNE